MVRITALMLTVLFVMLPLAGCLSNDENEDVGSEDANLLDAVALLEEQIDHKDRQIETLEGIQRDYERDVALMADVFQTNLSDRALTGLNLSGVDLSLHFAGRELLTYQLERSRLNGSRPSVCHFEQYRPARSGVDRCEDSGRGWLRNFASFKR